MLNNERIIIYKKQKKSDGMGGYTDNTEILVDTVICSIINTNTELINNKYSLNLTDSIAFQTKYKLDDSYFDYFFKFNNKEYFIYSRFKANNTNYLYVCDRNEKA